eukprot:2488698-Rhodomonas_salina.1
MPGALENMLAARPQRSGRWMALLGRGSGENLAGVDPEAKTPARRVTPREDFAALCDEERVLVAACDLHRRRAPERLEQRARLRGEDDLLALVLGPQTLDRPPEAHQPHRLVRCACACRRWHRREQPVFPRRRKRVCPLCPRASRALLLHVLVQRVTQQVGPPELWPCVGLCSHPRESQGIGAALEGVLDR